MSRMWFSSLASLRGSVLRPERTSREREVRHGQVPDWLAEPQWWAWLNKNLAVGKFGGWNSWNPWNTRMKIHPNSWDEEIGYMRVLTCSHRCFFPCIFGISGIWPNLNFEFPKEQPFLGATWKWRATPLGALRKVLERDFSVWDQIRCWTMMTMLDDLGVWWFHVTRDSAMRRL